MQNYDNTDIISARRRSTRNMQSNFSEVESSNQNKDSPPRFKNRRKRFFDYSNYFWKAFNEYFDSSDSDESPNVPSQKPAIVINIPEDAIVNYITPKYVYSQLPAKPSKVPKYSPPKPSNVPQYSPPKPSKVPQKQPDEPQTEISEYEYYDYVEPEKSDHPKEGETQTEIPEYYDMIEEDTPKIETVPEEDTQKEIPVFDYEESGKNQTIGKFPEVTDTVKEELPLEDFVYTSEQNLFTTLKNEVYGVQVDSADYFPIENNRTLRSLQHDEITNSSSIRSQISIASFSLVGIGILIGMVLLIMSLIKKSGQNKQKPKFEKKCSSLKLNFDNSAFS